MEDDLEIVGEVLRALDAPGADVAGAERALRHGALLAHETVRIENVGSGLSCRLGHALVQIFVNNGHALIKEAEKLHVGGHRRRGEHESDGKSDKVALIHDDYL